MKKRLWIATAILLIVSVFTACSHESGQTAFSAESLNHASYTADPIDAVSEEKSGAGSYAVEEIDGGYKVTVFLENGSAAFSLLYRREPSVSMVSDDTLEIYCGYGTAAWGVRYYNFTSGILSAAYTCSRYLRGDQIVSYEYVNTPEGEQHLKLHVGTLFSISDDRIADLTALGYDSFAVTFMDTIEDITEDADGNLIIVFRTGPYQQIVITPDQFLEG